MMQIKVHIFYSMRRTMAFLLMVISFVGCRNEMEPREFLNYYNENEELFTSKTTSGSITMVTKLIPSQLYEAKSILSNKKIAICDSNCVLNVLVKLSCRDEDDFLNCGLSKEEDYSKRVNYFLNDIANDFFIVTDNDTISALYCLYESRNGLANYSSFLVSFEIDQSGDEIELVYQDKIMGFGEIKSVFTKNPLKNIPQIKLIE